MGDNKKVNDKKDIETRVTLTKDFDLDTDIKQKIDEWLETKVINKGIGWVHIYKYLDELHIYGEGYNTPPLAILNFDIESLDPEIAQNLGNTVYKYFQKKTGIEEGSEYLQYQSLNRYVKEENQGKIHQWYTQMQDEDIDNYETYLYQGNTFFNILSSLYENGNCRVYTNACYPRQIVYDFYVDEQGKLKVTSSTYNYDKSPWKNETGGIRNLETPIKRSEIQECDVKVAIADLVTCSRYDMERVVTTHKPIKRMNTLSATNEAFAYIYNMHSLFENEDTENWLEENNLLARWVKGNFNGKINLLINETPDFKHVMNFQNKSYYEMMSKIFSAIESFNNKVIPVQRKWKKIQNGEYDVPMSTKTSPRR